MKRVLFVNMIAAVVGIATVFAIPAGENLHVVRLTDMKQELLQDYFSGHAENIIVECPEGICLPLNFSISGEFLSVESVPHAYFIRVLKTCYIKSSGDKFLFSVDLQNWKEFAEFFTGSLGISFGLHDDQQQVGLSLEMNQRQM